ncbi:hypothetical protein Tco_0737606 [Tanacetum coccineum]|uniref:Uncharacterized protein n=1 Tax=Tanacetum coccineum TaxID=301880 RepID=A0ABQ5FPD7_9ASTR
MLLFFPIINGSLLPRVRQVSQLIVGSGITGGDNSNKNDILCLMASMRSSPFWNTRTIRPESCCENLDCMKVCVMIDELSIVETDKVNHTVETDKMKLVVEAECFGKCVDEFDKETVIWCMCLLEETKRIASRHFDSVEDIAARAEKRRLLYDTSGCLLIGVAALSEIDLGVFFRPVISSDERSCEIKGWLRALCIVPLIELLCVSLTMGLAAVSLRVLPIDTALCSALGMSHAGNGSGASRLVVKTAIARYYVNDVLATEMSLSTRTDSTFVNEDLLSSSALVMKSIETSRCD